MAGYLGSAGQALQDEIDRVTAAFDLVGRTGAKACELRWSEPEEGELPVTPYMAIVTYHDPDDGEHDRWEVAAGASPQAACERLLERLLDGTGMCRHCGRPTTVLHELRDVAVLDGLCAYQYDPETKTYYRSCSHTMPAPSPFHRPQEGGS